MSGTARRLLIRAEGQVVDVELLDGIVRAGDSAFTVAQVDPAELVVSQGERQHRIFVAQDGAVRWVFFDGRVWEVEVETPGRGRRRSAAAGGLSSPMPATVVRVLAPAGTAVTRGETILVVEAMKMEMPLRAPLDGTVKAVNCREGELVQPGTLLAEIE